MLYCRAGQTTEEDMYNNEHGSDAFQQFLNILGKTVKLNGFDNFKGGLDVKSESSHAIFHYYDFELYFNQII